MAQYLLLPGQKEETYKQGFDFAIKAFELKPSQVPMRAIILAANFPELREKSLSYCKSYFDDFEKNKASYAKEHGYHNKIVAALIAVMYALSGAISARFNETSTTISGTE